MFGRRNDGFNEFSVGRILTTPFRYVGRVVNVMFNRDRAISSDRSLVGTIVEVVLFPFRLVSSFVAFMVLAWTASRNGRAFILGIPAIAAILGFQGALWLVGAYAESHSLTRSLAGYQFHLNHDLGDKNYVALYAQQRVELQPELPELHFNLAEAYQQADHPERAYSLMQSIASANPSGFSDAHNWLAEYKLRSRSEDESEEQRLAAALEYYENALEIAPDNVMTNYGVARIYLYQEKLEKALACFQVVISGDLETTIQLDAIAKIIDIHQKMGREDLARGIAKSAIERLRFITNDRPEIVEVWKTIVTCYVLLKDYNQAGLILQEAVQLNHVREVRDRLVKMAAQIFLRKANDNLDAEDEMQFKLRLLALAQSISIDFRNGNAYKELMDYVGNKELSETQLNWMQDSLIGAPQPGVIHVVLGLYKTRNGNVADGQKHWRIAQKQFPGAEFIINYLIEFSSLTNPEIGDDKMVWIGAAIETFPEQAAYVLTRGGFHFSDERFQEAVADFESVKKKYPNNIQVLEKLVASYEATGETKKAEDNRLVLQVIKQSGGIQQNFAVAEETDVSTEANKLSNEAEKGKSLVDEQ